MTDKALMAGEGMNHGRVEIPVPWPVTCHSDDENELSPEAKRKREQRERDDAAGVVELRVRIGPVEAAKLAEGLEFRAFGG